MTTKHLNAKLSGTDVLGVSPECDAFKQTFNKRFANLALSEQSSVWSCLVYQVRSLGLGFNSASTLKGVAVVYGPITHEITPLTPYEPSVSTMLCRNPRLSKLFAEDVERAKKEGAPPAELQNKVIDILSNTGLEIFVKDGTFKDRLQRLYLGDLISFPVDVKVLMAVS